MKHFLGAFCKAQLVFLRSKW